MSSALYRTALKLYDVFGHEQLGNMAHQLAIERQMHEIGTVLTRSVGPRFRVRSTP